MLVAARHPPFPRVSAIRLRHLHLPRESLADSTAYGSKAPASRTWHAFRYMSIERTPNASPLTTYHFRRITMKTLIIADLARTEQLDRAAMAAMRGGFKMEKPGYSFEHMNYAPSFDSSIHATQNLAQMQDVVTATANGSAFLGGVNVHSDVDQHGENKIVRRS
jgi:hypothetical protein